MWFATASGLNRYDGCQMTLFRSYNADPASLVGSPAFATCSRVPGKSFVRHFICFIQNTLIILIVAAVSSLLRRGLVSIEVYCAYFCYPRKKVCRFWSIRFFPCPRVRKFNNANTAIYSMTHKTYNYVKTQIEWEAEEANRLPQAGSRNARACTR